MSFTIPTNRQCPLILPFPDINQVLGGRPFVVHIEIGDMVHAVEQAERGIEWLHAPAGWPVFASSREIFQYCKESGKIQINGGNAARISVCYDEIVSMAEKLGINFLLLPTERLEESKTASSSKLKRKLARQTASINAAKEASEKCVSVKLVDGEGRIGDDQYVSINRGKDQSNEDWLVNIQKAMQTPGVIVHTDFPFRLAREGFLLNEKFDIIDMKNACMLNNMENLAIYTNAPKIVSSAASHSKSYIHHLFRCDELSGPILLAIVNLFQFDKLKQ